MVCPPQAALNSGANLVFTPQPHRARHSRAAGSCTGPLPAIGAERMIMTPFGPLAKGRLCVGAKSKAAVATSALQQNGQFCCTLIRLDSAA